MSNRTRVRQPDQVALPARARTADVLAGVPTEMSDRRAISLLAMFAFDESEDPPATSIDEGAGVVAFLPKVCAPARR